MVPSPFKDDGVTVDEPNIPSDLTMFFSNWSRSIPPPLPAEVRRIPVNHITVLKEPSTPRGQRVVCFPELGVVVKYGKVATTPVSEGQTLWVLSRVPPMRVPKVYGWCVDGDERFIYMEHIDSEGVTVEGRWPSLTHPQKVAVTRQLDAMVTAMRRLRQGPENAYIGSIHRGKICEQVWNGGGDPLGPLDSVTAFVDELLALGSSIPGYPYAPFFTSIRAAFSDAAPIVFTHADLHPSNIIMSSTNGDVLGIIDWHNNGWYPDFWEYIKAFWTVNWVSKDDWKDHVRLFVQPAYEEECSFNQYEQTGCFI